MGRSDYPYSAYPPYITAGAYLMSADTVAAVLAAARLLKLFPFDDVFLGLVADRLRLPLTHSTAFPAFQGGWLELLAGPDWTKVVAVHGVTGLNNLIEAMRKAEEP